jgi:hypothetical protein
MSSSAGPLTDFNKLAKPKSPNAMTKKNLKEFGQNIYSAFDEKCKENFKKSFSDILVMVPEAGLEKKQSPEDKRKIKRISQRKTKEEIEKKMTENDTDIHLSSRQSFKNRNVQRLALAFESKEEANQRIKKASPESRNRSHTIAIENIEGDLDRLMEDIKSWSDKEINWLQKAKEYHIRKKGDKETPQNGGQTLKAYLEAKGINTTQFKTVFSPNVYNQGKNYRVYKAFLNQRILFNFSRT